MKTHAKERTTRAPRRDRGSVLLPVVAAMLVLSLIGASLAELFAAQRISSVHGFESARAFWAAEAGVWHAAHEGTEIATPVAFAGATYTVAKAGDRYTATASVGSATRVASATLAGPGSGGGPLDVAASAASAFDNEDDEFQIDLVSAVAYPVVIASFELSADRAMPPIRRLYLNDERIWDGGAGVALPTGVVTLNDGSTSDRTVAAGASPDAVFDFDVNIASGAVAFTLIVHFTDGSSSTISFSVSW